jgi:hypothetical protein
VAFAANCCTDSDLSYTPPLKPPAEIEVIDAMERHLPAGSTLIENALEAVYVKRVGSRAGEGDCRGVVNELRNFLRNVSFVSANIQTSATLACVKLTWASILAHSNTPKRGTGNVKVAAPVRVCGSIADFEIELLSVGWHCKWGPGKRRVCFALPVLAKTILLIFPGVGRNP